MLGRIVAIYFIYHFCIGIEGAVAVRETFWYENLVPFASTQHHADMTTEARGIPAYVNRNIKYRPRYHAEQLCLCEGRDLKMKSANHPFAQG